MAANKTIIQAVADAETRIPVDFTGYIDSLEAVTKVIVANQEAAANKINTLGDSSVITATPEYFQAALAPVVEQYDELLQIENKWSNSFTEEGRQNIQAAKLGIKSIESFLETIKEDDNLVKEWIKGIEKQVENGDLSNWVDPAIENYYSSIAAGRFGDLNMAQQIVSGGFGYGGTDDYMSMHSGGFRKEVTEGDIQALTFFRVNLETMQYEVVGPDGNYTNIRNLPANPVLKSDTDDIKALIDDFEKYSLKINPTDLEIESENTEYNKNRRFYMGKIQDQIDENPALLGPLMVDKKIGYFDHTNDGVSNKKASNFVDWYFWDDWGTQEGGGMDIAAQWEDYLKRNSLRPIEDRATEKQIEKMKMHFFKLAWEADEDIKEDYMLFLQKAMDSYVK